MEISIIIICILILYVRTYKHHNVIDDICTRWHYLREHTKDIEVPEHYEKRRPIPVTIECILTHIGSCSVIYLLWGFKASLLYAVSPLLVHCVAWKTGALIYGSSTFLLLTAHYFIVNYGLGGLIFGALLYYASIQCSLSTLTYAFLIPFVVPQYALHGTILYISIMLLFLSSNRFRSALKVRIKIHSDMKVKSAGKWEKKRIIVMIKVVAYYIMGSLTPPWMMRGGFFSDAPYYIHNYRLDKIFWLDLLLIILFYSWAWMVSPLMALWHLVFVGLYSQFKMFGMLVADRYQSVFTIGLCVLLAKTLPNEAFIVLASLWFYRSLLYIKIFRNNSVLFRESILAYPYAPENQTNLASDFMKHNRHDLAITPLLYALKTSSGKNSPQIMQNLSVCYAKVGKFSSALHYTNEVLKRCPADQIITVQKQKRDLEAQIKRMEHHKKALKRRGII